LRPSKRATDGSRAPPTTGRLLVPGGPSIQRKAKKGRPMKDPWQAYLQLGVVHFMAFPECLTGDGPQFETLREICYDPFFDAVDVGPINDPIQRRECAALLRDCQMTVTFACQPVQLQRGLDLNAADDQRRAAVEAVL